MEEALQTAPTRKAKRGGLAPSRTLAMQREELAREHAERELEAESSPPLSLPARAARALKKTVAAPVLPGWMRPVKKVKLKKVKFRKVKALSKQERSAREHGGSDGQASGTGSAETTAGAAAQQLRGSRTRETLVTRSGWLSKMNRKGKVRTCSA